MGLCLNGAGEEARRSGGLLESLGRSMLGFYPPFSDTESLPWAARFWAWRVVASLPTHCSHCDFCLKQLVYEVPGGPHDPLFLENRIWFMTREAGQGSGRNSKLWCLIGAPNVWLCSWAASPLKGSFCDMSQFPAGGFNWTSREQTEHGGNSWAGPEETQGLGEWLSKWLRAGEKEAPKWFLFWARLSSGCFTHSKHLTDSLNAPAWRELEGQGKHMEGRLQRGTGANQNTGGAGRSPRLSVRPLVPPWGPKGWVIWSCG